MGRKVGDAEETLQKESARERIFAARPSVCCNIYGLHTSEFLKTQAAELTITRVDGTPNGLAVDVHVENLGSANGNRTRIASSDLVRSSRNWLILRGCRSAFSA